MGVTRANETPATRTTGSGVTTREVSHPNCALVSRHQPARLRTRGDPDRRSIRQRRLASIAVCSAGLPSMTQVLHRAIARRLTTRWLFPGRRFSFGRPSAATAPGSWDRLAPFVSRRAAAMEVAPRVRSNSLIRGVGTKRNVWRTGSHQGPSSHVSASRMEHAEVV